MIALLQNAFSIALAIFLAFVACILLYYKYAFNHWKKLGIPYPEPSFPFGNMKPKFAKYIGQSIAEIYLDMKQKGESYCGYYLFAVPVFMPIDLRMTKHFLTIDFNSFHDRGFHYDEVNDPMGASIVTYSGEKWKKMRELLTPSFTTQKTKMMMPIMKKCSKELENVMNDAINKGEPIVIADVAKRYTVDVICSCAFGVECNCLKDPKAEFFRHAKMVFTTSIRDNMRLAIGMSAPFFMKLFKIELFNPTATRFFSKVVHETVAYREQNNVVREDFMNLMIRLKNKQSIEDDHTTEQTTKNNSDITFTVNQIAAQCFLFFLAGFETAAAALNYTMFELAYNKKIQNKLRQEILQEVHKSETAELTYDNIKNMAFLDCVLNEALRKYPVVQMLNRIVSKDFKIPDTNIVIKKGTRAVLSTLGLHMDPEYYPDPEKFDPDRFAPHNRGKIPAFAYVPFGDGPRVCPGTRFGIIEVKLCIATLIMKFDFSVHSSVKIPIKLCSLGNVLGTEEPILLTVQRVSSNSQQNNNK